MSDHPPIMTPVSPKTESISSTDRSQIPERESAFRERENSHWERKQSRKNSNNNCCWSTKWMRALSHTLYSLTLFAQNYRQIYTSEHTYT